MKAQPQAPATLPPEIVSMIKRLARQAAAETRALAAPAAEHAKVPADR